MTTREKLVSHAIFKIWIMPRSWKLSSPRSVLSKPWWLYVKNGKSNIRKFSHQDFLHSLYCFRNWQDFSVFQYIYINICSNSSNLVLSTRKIQIPLSYITENPDCLKVLNFNIILKYFAKRVFHWIRCWKFLFLLFPLCFAFQLSNFSTAT